MEIIVRPARKEPFLQPEQRIVQPVRREHIPEERYHRVPLVHKIVLLAHPTRNALNAKQDTRCKTENASNLT